MTYHHSPLHKIKQEPLSPLSTSATGPGMTTSQLTNGWTGTRVDTYPSPKRLKLENSEREDCPASKQETMSRLKSVLIDRRKAKGQPDVPSDLFEDLNPNYELTKEELERREKRKEQNRRAAKRCRAKKKAEQDKVVEETAMFADENTRLQNQICLLFGVLMKLNTYLKEHLDCGDCKLSRRVQLQHRMLTEQVPELVGSHPIYQSEEPACRSDSTPSCSSLEESGSEYRRGSPSEDSCMLPPGTDQNELKNMLRPRVEQTELKNLLHQRVEQTELKNLLHQRVEQTELKNLASWDLESITPDIPKSGISSLTEYLDNTSKTPSAELTYPAILSTADLNSTANLNTCDLTYPANLNTADSFSTPGQFWPHPQYTSTPHNPSIAQLTLEYNHPYFDDQDSLLDCVSPNAVQPNFRQFQPSNQKFLPLQSAGESISFPVPSQDPINIHNNNNDNNHKDRQYPKEFGSLSPAYDCEIQMSSIPAENVFNFDCSHGAPAQIGVSGQEPTSPFYNQMSGTRL